MMKHRPFLLTFAALAFGSAWPISGASAAAQPIFWSALRPADQARTTMPLSGKAVSGLQGDTLAWHDEGRPVELTGFVLPIDHDGDLVYEFMLVPWAGACSHMPSPPPNQLVRVVPKEPLHLAKIYETVTVTGAPRPGLDQAQFFMIDGVRILAYGYSMSHAQVAKATATVDPDLLSLSPFGVLPR
ncbi:DUF3299 domain-containing protein [Rhizobium lentis]|uniref:DUF3299 domain-containing protein n=1 Tax=Rhizobium lentis TaxID=1138194 RepID=UPI001C83963C|nr:DUF3299 domain-containing protein [Rhizobium lentis]MBX5041078.1 DUF3299 domain-containing protein [Rhizobium lentis]MBX5051807.1 DUF3299 domain-containing protein [Rhizobium lentis]MBX5071364.1 DUF3299 domain-containing protein [Rhizobium lentis]MBX5108598.1 DUF3299 domain-containing protein [Rhizobium lentis]MBX5117722.1 DUF3299 domain-containing protein [Rhizobium lentis]